MDQLLANKDYLHEREKLLEGAVITEERFVSNIKGVIEKQKTDYCHEFKLLDTKKFRQEYYERFDLDKTLQIMARKKNIMLFRYFPCVFIREIPKRIFNYKNRKG